MHAALVSSSTIRTHDLGSGAMVIPYMFLEVLLPCSRGLHEIHAMPVTATVLIVSISG